jgi:hypothetical protein
VKRRFGTIYLIPELCNFTGLNEKTMKFGDLREVLFKKPDVKGNDIK